MVRSPDDIASDLSVLDLIEAELIQRRPLEGDKIRLTVRSARDRLQISLASCRVLRTSDSPELCDLLREVGVSASDIFVGRLGAFVRDHRREWSELLDAAREELRDASAVERSELKAKIEGLLRHEEGFLKKLERAMGETGPP